MRPRFYRPEMGRKWTSLKRYVSVNVYEQNHEKQNPELNKIYGQNPEWTKFRIGRNPEWTKSQMNKVQN